jgi:hypothetical protein
MDRSLKVAMPLTAFRVSVPNSVPPPGLVPMLSVTASVAVVTVLPAASRIATWIGGKIGLPADHEFG